MVQVHCKYGVFYLESSADSAILAKVLIQQHYVTINQFWRKVAMDLESVFDGPLSTGSSGKKSGVSVSVWQAEVALRLSE